MGSKRLLLLLSAILLVITLAALPFMSSCAKPAPAEVKPIELKMSFCYGDIPTYRAVFGIWADNVHERTGGRVTISHYFWGELFPPEETYDAVIRGTIDIGISSIQMTPGRFPCYELTEVSLLSDECARPSRVSWELYNALPEIQEELTETKVLATLAMLPFPPGIGLGTTDTPVRTLEDFEGLKIAGYGRWMPKTLIALGVAPTDVGPPPAFYEALEKGIIDGVVMDPSFFEIFMLSNVIHYYTVGNFGTYEAWVFSMNWDTWNSLPPDIQEVLEEESVPFVMDTNDEFCWEDSARALQETVDNFGLEVIEPSTEELARWVALQKPVQQDAWVAEMEAKGLPGEMLIEEANRLYAKYRTR